jgi:hypothetical protein
MIPIRALFQLDDVYLEESTVDRVFFSRTGGNDAEPAAKGVHYFFGHAFATFDRVSFPSHHSRKNNVAVDSWIVAGVPPPTHSRVPLDLVRDVAHFQASCVSDGFGCLVHMLE